MNAELWRAWGGEWPVRDSTAGYQNHVMVTAGWSPLATALGLVEHYHGPSGKVAPTLLLPRRLWRAFVQLYYTSDPDEGAEAAMVRTARLLARGPDNPELLRELAWTTIARGRIL